VGIIGKINEPGVEKNKKHPLKRGAQKSEKTKTCATRKAAQVFVIDN
jgi:hypothetical protein